MCENGMNIVSLKGRSAMYFNTSRFLILHFIKAKMNTPAKITNYSVCCSILYIIKKLNTTYCIRLVRE